MGFGSIFNRKKKKQSSPSNAAAAAAATAGDSPSPVMFSTPSRNLSESQIQELEHVFNKFDCNGDGKISSSELGSMLACLGHEATEEELHVLIKEIDADGDGFIDFKEFVELNTKGVDAEEVLENLKDAFSVYDIDGNGSISAEELHKVMKSLGDECSISECRKMISGVDADGDGMIDFEEFKTMMLGSSSSSRYESQNL